MKVSEIMSSRVVCISQDEPVSAAAKLLKRSNIGALPVCDGDRRLRGIVTDRDIVTRCVALDADPASTRVAEIMSRGVVTASPLDEVSHAARVMCDDQVRRLPVLDEGKLIGMVSLCDLARDAGCDMEAAEALSEISSNVRRK
jgi:CBS domain-containing protein